MLQTKKKKSFKLTSVLVHDNEIGWARRRTELVTLAYTDLTVIQVRLLHTEEILPSGCVVMDGSTGINLH